MDHYINQLAKFTWIYLNLSYILISEIKFFITFDLILVKLQESKQLWIH